MIKNLFSAQASGYKKFSIILNSIFFLFIAAFIFFIDFKKILTAFVQDDAFYYFKIADNLISTGTFTFDGFSGTNGFHPLWLIFILPVFLSKLSPEHKTDLILILHLLLILLSLNLLLKRLKTFFQSVAVIFVFNFFLLEFFHGYLSGFLNGMESALLFFVYTIFLCYTVDRKIFQPESTVNYFVLGILSGLIILTRLDQIFLIPVFLGYLIFSDKNEVKKKVTESVKFAAGFMLLFAPYLLLNYIYMGHIMPITGLLKSGFPHLNSVYHREDFNIISVPALIAILAAPLAISLISYKKESYNKALTALAYIFCFTMMLNLSYETFFIKWGLSGWHFSIYIFLGLPGMLILTELIFTKLKFKPAWIIIFFLLLNLHVAYNARSMYKYTMSRGENQWQVQAYNAVQWVKQNTPQETVFAMSDAGIFSFISEHRTVNLDGLVNDLHYQEVLKKHELLSYLKERNVKYIVHHAIWDNDNVIDGSYSSFTKFYPSHLYEGASDSLILKKENEVYRSAPYYDGSHKAVFIIWKLE